MKQFLQNNTHGMQDIIIDLLNSLSAVKDLSEINCKAGSEKELIKNALRVLIQNQDMERCSFFLHHQGSLINLTGLSTSDLPGQSHFQHNSLQFKIGEGVIGIAAATGALQNCENCHEDERFAVSDQSENCLLPGSIVSAPIYTSDKELIGVLNISHPHPHHFTEWHLRLLEIYKNMLGQLITNYRLIQKMEEQISLRTHNLEQALDDLKTLKDHFESISMIDPLTGLYNRRYFYDQVELAIANSKRYGQRLCLLMMDLDYFKDVNDNYGHGFGDEVLMTVSKELQQHIRETDILVRFGGEEFIIIFQNTNCCNGNIFAERIRSNIESIIWPDKPNFTQTVSIGLYCLDTTGNSVNLDNDISIDHLVHDADTALYLAKKQGRNRVVIFKKNTKQESTDDQEQ